MMRLMSFAQDSLSKTKTSFVMNPDHETSNARVMFTMLSPPLMRRNAKQAHHVRHNEQLKGLNPHPLYGILVMSFHNGLKRKSSKTFKWSTRMTQQTIMRTIVPSVLNVPIFLVH